MLYLASLAINAEDFLIFSTMLRLHRNSTSSIISILILVSFISRIIDFEFNSRRRFRVFSIARPHQHAAKCSS